MPETLTKQYFDEQFDTLIKAVKGGFDSVDERFDAVDARFDAVDERFNAVDKRFTCIEEDLAHIKDRLAAVEDEVQTLSRTMVTKQYLDAKIDRIVGIQYQDTLFKKRLLLALEEAKVLTPEVRAKLEHLIPALTINE